MLHRSAITKARRKIRWELFESLFDQAVKTSYALWPSNPQHEWHGMSVIAFDGSKYQLPASDEIREYFDPTSGLECRKKGRGHYPLCLVSTAFDVFRRIPIARTVVPNTQSNERDQAIKLIEKIPPNNLLLFDRGYPSYDLIQHLNSSYHGFFLFRCRTSSTFHAVQDFIQSGKKESILYLTPSKRYQNKVGIAVYRNLKPLKLRVIRMDSPAGESSVLLTNLMDRRRHSRAEITKLYFRRWEVETYYRDEKVVLGIETLHSKSVNGIMQELFAITLMSLIARTLASLYDTPTTGKKTTAQPQFKHAIITLAENAAVLTAANPRHAYQVFTEIVAELKRVQYYRPNRPRPSQPRLSKTPQNKWRDSKKRKMGES